MNKMHISIYEKLKSRSKIELGPRVLNPGNQKTAISGNERFNGDTFKHLSDVGLHFHHPL